MVMKTDARLFDISCADKTATQGVLNNKDIQVQICPGLDYSSKAPGRLKKVRPARPQPFYRAERTLST
ncbi:MAG: hypothetical protein NPIRA06_24840 [Nitrospirales bacterium]|nr:MAG: hypothetical protein NPIRA06_24840 [Nitrospirales bacterium]